VCALHFSLWDKITCPNRRQYCKFNTIPVFFVYFFTDAGVKKTGFFVLVALSHPVHEDVFLYCGCGFTPIYNAILIKLEHHIAGIYTEHYPDYHF